MSSGSFMQCFENSEATSVSVEKIYIVLNQTRDSVLYVAVSGAQNGA